MTNCGIFDTLNTVDKSGKALKSKRKTAKNLTVGAIPAVQPSGDTPITSGVPDNTPQSVAEAKSGPLGVEAMAGQGNGTGQPVKRLIKRTRSDCKVDAAKALELHTRGVSLREIAKIQGCSKDAVHHAITRLYSNLPDSSTLEEYRARQAGILDGIGSRILSSIDEDTINKARLTERITGFAILTDKSLLLQGKATSNVAIHSVVQSAASEVERARQELDKILHVVPDELSTAP